MKLPTRKSIVLAFILMLLAGCESGEFSHCVSPQISGRVLAADTHQPLAGANVARVTPPRAETFGPPKGGQVLMEKSGVRTDADGRFVLDGERVIAFFRQPGWWSTPVNFSCAGYQPFQKNYSATNVTSHSSSDMPMIDAGDVLLKPLAK